MVHLPLPETFTSQTQHYPFEYQNIYTRRFDLDGIKQLLTVSDGWPVLLIINTGRTVLLLNLSLVFVNICSSLNLLRFSFFK